MARTHTFKGSNFSFGYYAFIEDSKLVIGEERGRGGGIIYHGDYKDVSYQVMYNIYKDAPKLHRSILEYYSEEINKTPGPYSFPHTFKDSRDLHGNGWYGYIEEGKLVIGHEAPREGGILFRGTYEEAAERGWIATLLREDQRLHEDIEKHFSQKRAKANLEKMKRDCGFDEETKTILFKVKLFMDNREVHNVLVRGRFQADVIKKLMPQIPEVLTLQTWDAREFAVRSNKIDAVEFVEN